MEKDNYFLTKTKNINNDQSVVIVGINTSNTVKCKIRDNFNNAVIIDWLELTPIGNKIEIPNTVIAQLIPTQYEFEFYNKEFNKKVVINVRP